MSLKFMTITLVNRLDEKENYTVLSLDTKINEKMMVMGYVDLGCKTIHGIDKKTFNIIVTGVDLSTKITNVMLEETEQDGVYMFLQTDIYLEQLKLEVDAWTNIRTKAIHVKITKDVPFTNKRKGITLVVDENILEEISEGEPTKECLVTKEE